MTVNKSIHPTLIRSYREAKYVIEGSKDIVLKIGQANQDLRSILLDKKATTASFITAFNPYSEILNDRENIEAQESLCADIKSLGCFMLNGYGQDEAEEWPREKSVLSLGITESEAEALADKYGQNGFVWIGTLDAFPALRLRHSIQLPINGDVIDWLLNLSPNLRRAAEELSPLDQAWLISASEVDQAHWLDPDSWDLNKPWPLAKPNGSTMGIGTELDRVFKLIAAGQSSIVR